ncbi:UPF0057-domain-containing protein [Suillus decipiens]|nr:UPF0057-domain-containing protein [Suillus decipiens]
MESNDTADCVLILVAVIFPPAAAAFVSGCGCDLFLNILLTLLGYLPGLIHALWLVFKRANGQTRRARGSYQYTDAGTPAPAPQQSVPAPQQSAPAPQQSAPAPQQSAPAPQQSAPPPEYVATNQPGAPQPTTATSQPVDAPPVGKN